MYVYSGHTLCYTKLVHRHATQTEGNKHFKMSKFKDTMNLVGLSFILYVLKLSSGSGFCLLVLRVSLSWHMFGNLV